MLLFMWRSKSFVDVKRIVLGSKLKQKRDPRRRKVANLGMKKRKFSRTGTRALGLINLHRSAKRNMAMNSVVLHPKLRWESVEKKIKGTNLPEKNVTKTIVFPWSPCLLTVNLGGCVISLAGGFSCWHISDKPCHVHKSLEGETRICFSKGSFLSKRIYRVCRIDGFPWNLARSCTDD